MRRPLRGSGRRGAGRAGGQGREEVRGVVAADGRSLIPDGSRQERGRIRDIPIDRPGILCSPGDRVVARRQPGRDKYGVCGVLERQQRLYFGVVAQQRKKLVALLLSPAMGNLVCELRLDGRPAAAEGEAGEGSDRPLAPDCLVAVRVPAANPKGRREVAAVEEVLGRDWEPAAVRRMAERAFGLQAPWGDEGDAWAAAAVKEASAGADEKREDAEGLPLATIDDADARDFDDAVAVRANGSGGWTAWVAIADVSHYVRPGTPLDEGARLRGNSSYFLDCALPMLPPLLSEDACSLRPGERRRAALCRMEFDARGKRVQARLCRAWIRSRARLTYAGVGQAWDRLEAGDSASVAEALECGETVAASLAAAAALAGVLARRRRERGAVALSIPEPKAQRDAESGRLLDLKSGETEAGVGRARNLVEEMMLAANVAAAEYIGDNRPEGNIFRIHDSPDAGKFRDMLESLGQLEGVAPGSLDGVTPSAEGLKRLLEAVEQLPARSMAHEMIRNSQAQALYAGGPEAAKAGHFALQSERYTHFTSPIRRYVDLLVHRQIFAGRAALGDGEATEVAQHCSVAERASQRCETFVRRFLNCELARRNAGSKVRVRLQAVRYNGVELRALDYGEGGWMPDSFLRARGFHPDPESGCLLRAGANGQLRPWLRLGGEVTMMLQGATPISHRMQLQFQGLQGRDAVPSARARGRRRSKPRL